MPLNPFIKRPTFTPIEGENLYFPYMETPRAFEKLAAELHPKIAAWLKTWKSNPNFPVVVITPMGSSEYYGDNSNGDTWPEDQLRPPSGTREYGYKTFENASLFTHHRNKDPSVTLGRIPLSVWDPRMHRIEVVAVYDRKRCSELGADYVVEGIDRGEFSPVSMGARVAYDICTICGHKSRNTSEYCQHLRTMMGQVLPDGRLVSAVNIRPKFFDLSAVHVPAAKESGMLAKVASEASTAPIRVQRRTAVKKADEIKRADIDKRVLSNVRRNVVDPIVSREAPVAPLMLRRLATRPVNSVLASLGYGGAVLSPREFSCMALHRAGHHGLGASLPENFGFPWSYPDRIPSPYPQEDILGDIVRMLRPLFTQRSVMPKVMIIRVRGGAGENPPLTQKIASVLPTDVVTELSDEYGLYRGRLLVSFAKNAVAACKQYPQFVDPAGLSKQLSKRASASSTKENALAQTAGALYLLGAHGPETTFPSWWDEIESPLLETFDRMETA